jgi:hypothetical protein
MSQNKCIRKGFLTVGRSLLAVLLVLAVSATSSATALTAAPSHKDPPLDFGPNVIIFDPGMPTSEIQAVVDAIAAQQVDSEMGTGRYALLFKPGTYGSAENPLWFQVGYYTEVAGLGASPTDVVINGHIDVYNRCLTPDNCIALVNFWRSLSNLTIQVTGKGVDGCRDSGNFWAVSQAAPMRRVNITGGNLTLMDYCTAGPQYASGGFIADSQTGFIVNGSQQQFLVRNSSIGGWSNGVWNQVFSGVEGAPPQSFGPTPYDPPPYTTLDTSPVTREKPFLYIDSSGKYFVFVPALRHDSAGTSWGAGPAAGSSIPIREFFIAKPGDSVSKINAALARGENLIFTPGIYHINKTLKVKRAGTIVLGLGYPTLIPDNGNIAMSVADVKGVILAGLLIDAGPKNSPALLEVGTQKGPHGRGPKHGSDPNNPTSLHDVFFRIGGAAPGKATLSLVVNSDDVILDHIWAWRADHGQGVGWDVNRADTGVVVNGDNVIAYGMFVEHYQKYQLIWNGENGRTIFFQNEMPYDPPSQEAWSHDGVNGFAAYKVADSVETHEAWGMGSYCFFNVGPDIHAERAFEVPVTPGVKLHDILTVFLNANGGIDHVVNDTGAAVNSSNQVTNIVSYP